VIPESGNRFSEKIARKTKKIIPRSDGRAARAVDFDLAMRRDANRWYPAARKPLPSTSALGTCEIFATLRIFLNMVKVQD
jgi:hypothetical protein